MKNDKNYSIKNKIVAQKVPKPNSKDLIPPTKIHTNSSNPWHIEFEFILNYKTYWVKTNNKWK